jgi:thiamine kinase-like enzyme
MKVQIAHEVLAAFGNYEPGLPDHSPGEISIEPVPGGLINHSYKICSQYKEPFLLQCINKHVFADPAAVQENYINIWEYAQFEFTGLRLPDPRYCGKTITLYVDENENYWRAFEFIEDTKMLTTAIKKEQAAATARTFAKFTATFDDFNVRLLKKVIPGFHNLKARYEQLEEAMNGERYERMGKAWHLVDELKKRERYIHFYDIITESPREFPLRVMHHDAKISNVLFSKRNGRVICPVDFDTVMPGHFFSDLGDMIRSMSCSRDENSLEYDRMYIRKSFYESILGAYLAVMKKQLTKPENKYIHYAGLLMTYMQGMRFLTDYLEGDAYYKIDYPEQNLDRAMNQVTLLKRLEEFLVKEYSFKV